MLERNIRQISGPTMMYFRMKNAHEQKNPSQNTKHSFFESIFVKKTIAIMILPGL